MMGEVNSLLLQFDFCNLESSTNKDLAKLIMRTYLIAFFTLVFLSCNTMLAQEVSELNGTEISVEDSELTESSGIFNNSKSLFIDFENLEHLPTNFKVLNDQKEVVFSENLLDLPEDSIYEFDLNNLEKGIYSLQIHTYKHTVHQQLDIN